MISQLFLHADTQGKINTANTNASNAVSTANSAKSTASTASTNASNAVSTANSAKTTASTASTNNSGYIIPSDGNEISFTVRNEMQKQIITYDPVSGNLKTVTRTQDGSYTENGKTNATKVGSIEQLHHIGNSRQYGSLTLKKIDSVTEAALNNITFTLTKIAPTSGNSDKWFSGAAKEGYVNSIDIETGYTYEKVAAALNADDFASGKKSNPTGMDGILIVKNLPWGTYELREKTTLPGYQLDSSVRTFKIGPNEGETFEQDFASAGKEIKNARTHIQIQKTDRDDHALTNAAFRIYKVTSENGVTQKSDAQFYLTANADTLRSSFTITSTTGTIDLYGLAAGTYEIVETTAPEGYEIIHPFQFTIDAYGKCSVQDPMAVLKNGTSIPVIQIKNKPIQLSIVKQDKETSAVITDLRTLFTVTAVGNSKFAKTNADASGKSSITSTLNDFQNRMKAELIAEQTYTLEESVAPDGYKLMPYRIKFKVEKDGSLNIISLKDLREANSNEVSITDQLDSYKNDFVIDQNTSAFDTIVSLTIKDEQIKTDLVKQDMSGSVIAQSEGNYATFTVTPKAGTNSAFAQKPTDTETVTSIAGLNIINWSQLLNGRLIGNHTYTITEMAAPRGYTLMDSVDFKVDSYGRIQVLINSEHANAKEKIMTVSEKNLRISTAELTLKNEHTDVYFRKLSSVKSVANQDVQLENASFRLEGTFATQVSPIAFTSSVDNLNQVFGELCISLNSEDPEYVYTLTETNSPDGYENNGVKGRKFYLDSKGKIHLLNVNGSEEPITSADSTFSASTITMENRNLETITVTDHPVSISIFKRDTSLPETSPNSLLLDAKFLVTCITKKEQTNKAFADETESKEIIITNGEITALNQKLIVGNTYHFVETQAPDGFQLWYSTADAAFRSVSFDLTVLDDGTFTISNETTFVKAGEGKTQQKDAKAVGDQLTIWNTPITLNISKWDRDQRDNRIAGVGFTLMKWNTSTQKYEMPKTWTSTGDSAKIFTRISCGSYMLQETSVPEKGYNIALEPLYFNVGENGQITATKADRTTSFDGTDTETSTGRKRYRLTNSNYELENPAIGDPGEMKVDVYNAEFTDLMITKKDAENKVTMSGVTFRLEVMTSAGAKPVKLTPTGTAQAAHILIPTGKEQKVETTSVAAESVITIGNDGTATVKGLTDGTYRLTELSTREGFQMLSKPLLIVINRNAASFWKSQDSREQTEVTISSDHTFHMTVYNRKGLSLPATGVKSPWLPIPILLLITLLEGCFLSLYARKRKKCNL